MDALIALMLSAMTLFATCVCARAETFDDLWRTRIKHTATSPQSLMTIAADGKRLAPMSHRGPASANARRASGSDGEEANTL